MNKANGRVKIVGQIQQISEKFTKRDLVIEISDEKYVQYVSFQLSGQNSAMADDLAIGDHVEVFYNLKGREWTNPQGEVKYFNTLDAWKVQVVTASTMNHVENAPLSPIADDISVDSIEDDLPF